MVLRTSSLPTRSLRSLQATLKPSSRQISSHAAADCPYKRLHHGLTRNRVRPSTKISRVSVNAVPSLLPRYASNSASIPFTEAVPVKATLTEPEPSPYYTEPPTIFDDFDVGSSITPHIGYLKEMGLDFGWGPTSMIQWLVEHIHVYAGTPWWATIMISAAVLRVGLFKLFSDASDQGARMALLKDTYRPLSAKIKAAKEAKDQVMIMSLTNDLRVLWKDAGVKPWKGFLPILIQIPFGFGTFRLLRNMYEVPVPGMVDGGVLWFQDLTVADPLLILPISMGVVSYFTMKVTQNPRISTIAPSTAKLMRSTLPFLGGGIMLLYPACMQLTFLTTTVLAFGQSWLLLNKSFRHWLQLQPLVEYPPTQPISSMFNLKNQDSNTKKDTQEEKKNFISSNIAEFKEAGADLVKRGRELSGDKLSTSGRSKRDLKEAQAYEARRRREIAQAKFELEQEKEERRREREEGRRRAK